MWLIGISGPLNGQSLNLEDSEVVLGRNPSNAVHVNSPSVSWKHCIIKRKGSRYLISDLRSLNGTSVNEAFVDEDFELRKGDRIGIGDSIFEFFPEKEETPSNSAAAIQYNDRDMTVERKQTLGQDTVLLQDAHSQINLSILLRITDSLTSVQSGNLKAQVLRSIAEMIPAEYGVFSQFVADGNETESDMGWDRKHSIGPSVQPSQKIVNEVSQNRSAVLAEGIVGTASHPDPNVPIVRSVVCAPVQTGKILLGTIYFATSALHNRFSSLHLHLVWAVASIAGFAFQNAKRTESLLAENSRLRKGINRQMVGDSEAMGKVSSLVGSLASVSKPVTVLITGERGTGKDLVARAIHYRSDRAAKPFVPINCTTIQDTLFETELFGNEQGPFTGAVKAREGLLDTANGGTVLLNEIGDISPAIQVKLLSVIQDKEFRRVGGKKSIPLDVRWVVATNRDLKEDMKNGKFRQDLFDRLNVFEIQMPPLRDRPKDIPLLARHFADSFCEECGRPNIKISADVEELLKKHNWPGNIRELENTIQRAIILAEGGDEILLKHLPDSLNADLLEAEPDSDIKKKVKQFKRQLVISALEQTSGIIKDAAQILGISEPGNLSRMMHEELRIDVKRKNPLLIVDMDSGRVLRS